MLDLGAAEMPPPHLNPSGATPYMLMKLHYLLERVEKIISDVKHILDVLHTDKTTGAKQ